MGSWNTQKIPALVLLSLGFLPAFSNSYLAVLSCKLHLLSGPQFPSGYTMWGLSELVSKVPFRCFPLVSAGPLVHLNLVVAELGFIAQLSLPLPQPHWLHPLPPPPVSLNFEIICCDSGGQSGHFLPSVSYWRESRKCGIEQGHHWRLPRACSVCTAQVWHSGGLLSALQQQTDARGGKTRPWLTKIGGTQPGDHRVQLLIPLCSRSTI